MLGVAVDKQVALRLIRELNGLPVRADESDDVDLVIAEYLRTSLCSRATNPTDGGPVYVTRLTNAVSRQLAPLWPNLHTFRDKTPSDHEQRAEGDIAPDRVRRVLDRLHDMRDVVELGDGYWMPAPVRLVSIPNTDSALVVGGLSTSDLRKRVCSAIEVMGMARVVKTSQLRPELAADRSQWQSFRDWCGEAPPNLQEWTSALLAQARGRLATSAANVTNFEVYAPWLNKREPQFFRWMRFDDLIQGTTQPPPDLVLCRSVQSGFSKLRTYWLGVIDKKALRRESPIPLALVRRLAYGLDLVHEAPTQARWESGIVTLRNWLPPEEQRALLVFGRDVSAEPGRFPLKMEVAPEWRDWVANLLGGLGIEASMR